MEEYYRLSVEVLALTHTLQAAILAQVGGELSFVLRAVGNSNGFRSPFIKLAKDD